MSYFWRYVPFWEKCAIYGGMCYFLEKCVIFGEICYFQRNVHSLVHFKLTFKKKEKSQKKCLLIFFTTAKARVKSAGNSSLMNVCKF